MYARAYIHTNMPQCGTKPDKARKFMLQHKHTHTHIFEKRAHNLKFAVCSCKFANQQQQQW